MQQQKFTKLFLERMVTKLFQNIQSISEFILCIFFPKEVILLEKYLGGSIWKKKKQNLQIGRDV